MARPRKTSGLVYLRKDSAFWWITYWNGENRRIHESTATTDRQEAERFLRKRLDARDDGSLSSLLAGKNLTFGEWADWYLEMRSKPPFRSQKTHLMNINAIKLLRPRFGSTHLSDITPEAIESYLKAPTQLRKAGSNWVRHQAARKTQADDRASRIPRFTENAQRCCQAEAPGKQPLQCS